MSDSTRSRILEVMARGICNAHRTWPGRSAERQREIVEAAWPSHTAEAQAALIAYESHLQAEGMAVVPECEKLVEAAYRLGVREALQRGPIAERFCCTIERARLAASPYGKAVVKEKDDE